MNVCLVDTTPQNGSTEIWLGTPRMTVWSDMHPEGGPFGIKPERLEERRKVRPPVYPHLKRGSLVLRDIRTWHAGMPNHTDQTRVMLAFGYQARWHGASITTPLPESLKETAKELEKHNGTELCISWIPDGEYDNLYSKFNANFASAIKPERGSIHAGVLPPWMKGSNEY